MNTFMKKNLSDKFCLLLALAASGVTVVNATSRAKTPSTPTVQGAKPAKKTQAIVEKSAVPACVAVKPDADFTLPPIVMQFDPAKATGYDWAKLDKLPLYPLPCTRCHCPAPAAAAPRLRGSAFGYDPNEKVPQGTLDSSSGERAVANIYFTWLVPIGGILLIALMFYLLYLKAVFGVPGKCGLVLPLGFMVRFVLNQLFDD